MRIYLITILILVGCSKEKQSIENNLKAKICEIDGKTWYTQGIVLNRAERYVDVSFYKNGITKVEYSDSIGVKIKTNNWSIDKDSIITIKDPYFKAKIKYIDEYLIVFKFISEERYSYFEYENPNKIIH